MSNEEVTCKKCGYEAKSPSGLKAHQFRKHTKRGRQLARESAARMNSPKAREKSLATRERRAHVRIIPDIVSRPGPKPKQKHVSRAKSLQRAATREQVNFCPRCGCHLEAVGVALAFAAAQ